MLLNRWNRWLLIVGLTILYAVESRAQYSLRPVSELDLIKPWYPTYSSEVPAFEVNWAEQPYAYRNFGDLAQKAKSGSKVESLVIDVNSLKPGGIINLRQLQDVRVVNISVSGQVTAQTDSLFQLIQEWPLLERIWININTPILTVTPPAQLVALPAGLSNLPKLHDVRLMGNAVQWRESFNILSGLKTLRHLELSNWQPTTSDDIYLSGLQQIRELKISGQGWVIKPETFADLSQLTDLSLSNVKVDAAMFQRSLTGLTNLQKLTIEGIRSLTKLSLSGLMYLKAVELQNNINLVVDAGTFAGLSVVEQLVLRGQQATDLSEVCSLRQLRTLTISGTGRGKATVVPNCIGQLTQLSELRLENMLLSQIPAQIGSLRGLHKLSVVNCGLDSLPASFDQLSALQELNLSGNKLKQLPKLGQMRQLVQFNAANNQLTALPDDIGQLSQLKGIDVAVNKLTQLPASITRLTNLRVLTLNVNQLERLPDDLGKLRKLSRLTIGSNQLIALPESLGQLDSLNYLMIGKNRLRTLPTSFSRLKSLKTVAISGNELTTLPADIGALRQLTELRLEQLPLTELPKSVCELANLTALTINATRLRLLPDNIGALGKLGFVNLNQNELIALPNSIGGWKEVTTLILDGNRLEGLPNGIGRMVKLNVLRISGLEDAAGGAGGIQQLPDSIVFCTNLFSLQLLNQPQLDASDVLTKASQLKQLGSINLTNCNISQLPVIDWEKVSWQSFELPHNLLTELPIGILDAPSLISVSVQENHLPEPLNKSFYGKDALRVAFVEAGAIPLERLSKPNRRVSEAYQQMANRKAGQRDWDATFREMQKAIDFAPDTIISILYWHRANFHSSRKQYPEALSDYDKAIRFAPDLRKDKVLDPALPDQLLVGLWQEKATVFGIMGQYDTALSAIAKAESYLPTFGAIGPTTGMLHTERGRFLTLKNKLTDADSSYRRAIRVYEKLTYADPVIRLTTVELSLLTGQYDKAKQALTDLPAEQMQNGNATLKEYLAICLSVLKGEQSGTQATEQLTAYLNKQPARIYGWSFDLFDNWLAKSKLSPEKIAALHQLTNKTKERQFKPE